MLHLFFTSESIFIPTPLSHQTFPAPFHPGEEIGICGPTGSGKTTLIDVIAGLLQPTDGQVTVDGVAISGAVGRWQRSLGVVSQTVFLVDDTLRRNIALGIPDDQIDKEALAEAVDLAQL